ncbi:MAG: RNA methyltransferase [Verrucomicrobiota bacterium]
MPHFSKRGSDFRPAMRPAPVTGEFIAPTSTPRPRGSSVGPREVAPAAPRPVSTPAAPLPGSRSGPARDELKLCGLAAVRARFARDPASIQRLFFDHATGQRVGVICRVLSQAKKIYRQVEPAELEKISGSIHHGGIVAVVAPPPLRAATAEEAAKWVKRAETVLVLDRIGNAHNLGAIARTAAFFGVKHVVIPDHAGAARPSDAAHRVAEGGFEHLEVWLAKDLVGLAKDLTTAGYEVVAATTRGGRPEAPRRERGAKPVALVLGNEEHGLAPDLVAACTRAVTIPGSGKLESLNVSVAAAVLMWELLARR